MLCIGRYIATIFLVLLVVSCSSEQENTPENRVRTYAQLINQGKLEEAKSMCTPAAQAYIDALSEIMLAAQNAADTSSISIKQIKCEQGQDSILCTSVEYDGFEEYEKNYFLIKKEEQWWIDQPLTKGAIQNSEEVLEEE